MKCKVSLADKISKSRPHKRRFEVRKWTLRGHFTQCQRKITRPKLSKSSKQGAIKLKFQLFLKRRCSKVRVIQPTRAPLTLQKLEVVYVVCGWNCVPGCLSPWSIITQQQASFPCPAAGKVHPPPVRHRRGLTRNMSQPLMGLGRVFLANPGISSQQQTAIHGEENTLGPSPPVFVKKRYNILLDKS